MIVVFGAAVWPGGVASPALEQRVERAIAAAQRDPTAYVFLSGGVGRHGPAEAELMRTLIAGRVEASRLILDCASRDTLETVIAAVRSARAEGMSRLIACSDAFHLPRIRMLFALFGFRVDTLAAARAMRPGLHRRMLAREALAIPYDLIAGGWARLTRR